MSVYETACLVIKRLQSHGFIAYFAGGWVRDFLMEHPSDDIDIATDASVEDIQRLFPKTIPVGIQFGIVIVVEASHQFEVATFRRDQGYEDGRRPIGIEKATPKEDALRRDFTINGLFYDPLTETLFDYVDGEKDIEQKLIRAIGDPHLRFLEDRLRMIRAARYSCRFDFRIDLETQNAIKAHAHSLFPSVAIERVWQEFHKMRRFGNFKKFLVLLFDLHLLQIIFEELELISKDTLLERLSPLELFPLDAPIIAKLTLLLSKPTLEKKIALCERFKLSNEDKSFIRYLHLIEDGIFKNIKEPYYWVPLYAKEMFSLCLTIALSSASSELSLSVYHFHENQRSTMKGAIDRRRNNTPLITSQLLMSAGIKPGILMGQLLTEGEKIAINENINDPTQALQRLKESPLWPSY